MKLQAPCRPCGGCAEEQSGRRRRPHWRRSRRVHRLGRPDPRGVQAGRLVPSGRGRRRRGPGSL